jgi:hypothetical protein
LDRDLSYHSGYKAHNKKLWDNLGIIARWGVMVKGHLGTISPTILGNVLHNFAYKFYGSYVESHKNYVVKNIPRE